MAPFFMDENGAVPATKKKPARGGWKDCNTNQEEVLFSRPGYVTKVQLY